MMKQINVGASSGILPSCEVLPSRAEKQRDSTLDARSPKLFVYSYTHTRTESFVTRKIRHVSQVKEANVGIRYGHMAGVNCHLQRCRQATNLTVKTSRIQMQREYLE
jgi:hypothetical protein